jgi:hypothetical protein
MDSSPVLQPSAAAAAALKTATIEDACAPESLPSTTVTAPGWKLLAEGCVGICCGNTSSDSLLGACAGGQRQQTYTASLQQRFNSFFMALQE